MPSSKKDDRRIKRTRSALCQALITLSQEKGYDNITVQDILDTANVGRSTFYAHYLNKDHLLLSGMPEKITEYIQLEAGTLIPSVSGIFEHMQMAFPFFKALLGTDGAKVGLARGRQIIHKKVVNHLAELEAAGHQLSAPAAVTAEFLVGALISMMSWWLDNNMPHTPKEMNNMFQALAERGICNSTPTAQTLSHNG